VLERACGDARSDTRDAHDATNVPGKRVEAVGRRHRRHERHPAHPLRRHRRERKRVRAPGGPADRAEPLDVERRDEPLSPVTQRPKALHPAAAVDGEQTHAELGRDAIVGRPREARVTAAVQIDDGHAVRVADVVDNHASRFTSRTRVSPRPS
jgi:hypothetical protein